MTTPTPNHQHPLRAKGRGAIVRERSARDLEPQINCAFQILIKIHEYAQAFNIARSKRNKLVYTSHDYLITKNNFQL